MTTESYWEKPIWFKRPCHRDGCKVEFETTVPGNSIYCSTECMIADNPGKYDED